MSVDREREWTLALCDGGSFAEVAGDPPVSVPPAVGYDQQVDA